MRQLLLLIGLILIAGAGLWYFWLGPRWSQRLPPGWSWQANFIGITTYADETTGKFPDENTTSAYERSIYIIDETGRPDSVVLEDQYITRDLNTGEKLWEYLYRAPVDPYTGTHLQPEYRGDYFVFPRNVEKKTYSLRYNYLKGIPLKFQREEEIERVQTYLFAYKGRAEYTESYAGTPDYPGVKVEPGQDIRCADDQFVFKIWVEPVTGEILKVEESCASGDFIYEVATNQLVAPISRWGGQTAGDDVVGRAVSIRQERTQYLWATRYLPVLLLTTGLVCLGWGALPGKVPKRLAEEG